MLCEKRNHHSFDLYQCQVCGIKSFDKVLPADSELNSALQELPFYYEESKGEFNYAIELISRLVPKKILEIGAGRGYFLEKLKNSYDVRAVEYSDKSLMFLQEKNIKFDEKGLTYDFICAFQVMEHIENLTEFLKFCDEKLEVNGCLLILVPNNDSSYFTETINVLDFPPHHLHQFNEKALKYIAKVLNKEIIEYWQEPLRIEHYTCMIRVRRNKMMHRFPFIRRLFYIMDYLLIPYFYDRNRKEPGHTHAVLLQKKRS